MSHINNRGNKYNLPTDGGIELRKVMRHTRIGVSCELIVEFTTERLNYTDLLVQGVPEDSAALLCALLDVLSSEKERLSLEEKVDLTRAYKAGIAGLSDGTLNVSDVLYRLGNPGESLLRVKIEGVVAHYLTRGHTIEVKRVGVRGNHGRSGQADKLHVDFDEGSKQYFIFTFIGKTTLRLQYFNTYAEACRACISSRAQFLKRVKRVRQAPKLRSNRVALRIGPSWRSPSAPITREEFLDVLPLRGIRFERDMNSLTRQLALGHALDAFLDLSSVIDLPPAALTLDNSLALHFGRRRSGSSQSQTGAYDEISAVLSIPRPSHAGSIAHDWWLAFDNRLGCLAGQPRAFATNGLDRILWEEDQILDMLLEAGRLSSRIERCPLARRSSYLDQRFSKPLFSPSCQLLARAFEAWVKQSLETRDQRNDWLVNFQSWDAHSVSMDSEGQETVDPRNSTYPYPLSNEIGEITAAFEHFFRKTGPVHQYLTRVAKAQT